MTSECLVTKKSGAAGGFIEKIAAAKNKIFLSILWGKACRMMECHLKLFVNILIGNITSIHIMLAGIGMGNDACMTKAVSRCNRKR